MAARKRFSVMRDPVHGDVYLTHEELRVLDTPEMQRMRGIKQLGPAYLVFPGALHTRFDHSIGTVHVAQKMIEAINLSFQLDPARGIAIGEEEARVIRMAGLLHDVTHIPFGHNIEDQDALFERHDSAYRYERMFTRDTPIGRVLDDLGLREEVFSVLTKPGTPGRRDVPPYWSQVLSGTIAADILDYLAESHQRLAEGQGAELIWRDSKNRTLKPIDALKIYALKTAPAFEAAFYSGIRLAGPAEPYLKPVRAFARNLGVAFQILNDLKDWEKDDDNKRLVGGDLLGGRPTVLLALALENLKDEQRTELLDLVNGRSELSSEQKVLRTRALYYEAGVFAKAYQLVDKHQQKAEQVADEIQPDELRRLMYYLVDTVLDHSAEVKPTIDIQHLSFNEVLPIVSIGQSS